MIDQPKYIINNIVKINGAGISSDATNYYFDTVTINDPCMQSISSIAVKNPEYERVI